MFNEVMEDDDVAFGDGELGKLMTSVLGSEKEEGGQDDFGELTPEMTNVLGQKLELCNCDPMTGWHRDGYCRTGQYADPGKHIICVMLTADFLSFSKATGNDLSTPNPRAGFMGLRPGDKWCLCMERWIEAAAAGKAPMVVLEATHQSALKHVSLDKL